MKSQKEYWDNKIKEWTEVSYGGKKMAEVSLIERLANLFRGQITGRMEVALRQIGPMAKGKVILDLGCGLGDFCFAILPYAPKQVIGLDISGVAIKEARKLAEKKKAVNRVKFIRGDAGRIKKLPDFDIAVGLGFIDYLNPQEIVSLFRLIGNSYFFFSIFEKKRSLRNLIHAFYVKIKQCPGAFKYTRKELLEMIPQRGGAYFKQLEEMLFITNLPSDD